MINESGFQILMLGYQYAANMLQKCLKRCVKRNVNCALGSLLLVILSHGLSSILK